MLIEQPHVMALLAWFDAPRLLKRLHAQIDELSDKAAALGDEQRAELLLQIAAGALENERQEERLIADRGGRSRRSIHQSPARR